MDELDWLAERFEENRSHLRAVAYRVLGSASEADDAVQEAWLRFSRAGADEVENLGGRRREIVGAFLAASRAGDFDALLTLLDPDIVLRSDTIIAQLGGSSEVRGAMAVAATFSGHAKGARPALIDGVPGMMWAPGGQIRVVFDFIIIGEEIVAIELIADPEHLALFDVVPA